MSLYFCRYSHTANPTVITILNPCKALHTPFCSPWILYLPSNTCFIANQYNSMINVTVTVIKYTVWIKLKPIACNPNRNWAITQLINKIFAITFINVSKRCNFKRTSSHFALFWRVINWWSVRINRIWLNTSYLHIHIRSF